MEGQEGSSLVAEDQELKRAYNRMTPRQKEEFEILESQISELLAEQGMLFKDLMMKAWRLEVVLKQRPISMVLQPDIVPLMLEIKQFFVSETGDQTIQINHQLPSENCEFAKDKPCNEIARIDNLKLSLLIKKKRQEIQKSQKKIKDAKRTRQVGQQYLKGLVKTFCRMRRVQSDVGIDLQEKKVTFLVPDVRGLTSKTTFVRHPFTFDKVFSISATQQDIFEETRPYLKCAFKGISSTILLYGSTATGKTHSLFGPQNEDYAQRGFLFRSLQEMFELKEQFRREGTRYAIFCEAEEIYFTKRFDFVSKQYILPNKDRTQRRIDTLEEGLCFVKQLLANKRTAKTKQNNRSSRSHTLIVFSFFTRCPQTSDPITGYFNCVDLAGNQATDAEEDEVKKKETAWINSTIFALSHHILQVSKDQTSSFKGNTLVKALIKYLKKGAFKVLFFTGSNDKSTYSSTMNNFSKSAMLEKIKN